MNEDIRLSILSVMSPRETVQQGSVVLLLLFLPSFSCVWSALGQVLEGCREA